MSLINAIFVLYLIFLIIIGLWTFRLTKNQEDYILAGRKLGPWVTAFSERASSESAWLLLGLPGAVIIIGLGEIWTVIGIIFGIVISWNLIAEKLRIETEKYNALTIPEYLHRKYDDKTNTIRLFSSFIIAFFFLFYVSAQFHATGKVFFSLFGLDPIYGISIGAIIIVTYTIMGGLFAVAWTDLAQGILMLGTLVILPITGLVELYNAEKAIFDFEQADLVFQNNNQSMFSNKTGIESLIYVIGGLSWGLGYLGQPHLLIRYMAIRNFKDVRLAKKIAISWAVPGILGAFLIGLIGSSYFGAEFFETIDPEQVMPLLASSLLHPILAGLFISGAIAAIMSTADSQLLVASSAIVQDFIHEYLGFSLTPKNSVNLSRIVIILLGLSAYMIALYSQYSGRNIFGVVSYAWSGLGSAFGPVILLTLWWKGTTKNGVLAGLVTGFTTTVVWANIDILKYLVSERFSSFIFALLAVYFFSKKDDL